ncbi:MAG: hypothetical protein ACQR33_04010 [Candidatus Saccharibacteria bacterium]
MTSSADVHAVHDVPSRPAWRRRHDAPYREQAWEQRRKEHEERETVVFFRSLGVRNTYVLAIDLGVPLNRSAHRRLLAVLGGTIDERLEEELSNTDVLTQGQAFESHDVTAVNIRGNQLLYGCRIRDNVGNHRRYLYDLQRWIEAQVKLHTCSPAYPSAELTEHLLSA